MLSNRLSGGKFLMNRYDPELLHRRRVITFGVLTVAVILLITGFLYGIGVLHRSSTRTQQAALKSKEPVVVMYYSKTCPDCKKVAIDVHKNAWEVTATQATIGKLMPSPYRHKNIYLQWQNNEDKKLFKQNNVNSVPTFMVYRNGKPQPIANANGIDIYQYSGTNKQVIANIYHYLQINKPTEKRQGVTNE